MLHHFLIWSIAYTLLFFIKSRSLRQLSVSVKRKCFRLNCFKIYSSLFQLCALGIDCEPLVFPLPHSVNLLSLSHFSFIAICCRITYTASGIFNGEPPRLFSPMYVSAFSIQMTEHLHCRSTLVHILWPLFKPYFCLSSNLLAFECCFAPFIREATSCRNWY